MSRLAIYAIIVFIFIGSLGVTYHTWKRGVEHDALITFNQKQTEQNIKDHQQFVEQQKIIQRQQQEIVEKLRLENQQLNVKIQSVKSYLSSIEAQSKDRASSEILKRVIHDLAKETK
jgi:hypothetical protein